MWLTATVVLSVALVFMLWLFAYEVSMFKSEIKAKDIQIALHEDKIKNLINKLNDEQCKGNKDDSKPH